jgi:hypothetical protein
MTICRLLAPVAAVLAVLAAQATSASAQGIPNIPNIPGQEKARFKVVVEGTASSYVDAAGANDPGTCNVAVKAIHIDEEVTYGRGRGVTMEFARFGIPGHKIVSIQRNGRIGDASFAVKGTIGRAVGQNGLITRTPSDPQLEASCPSATEVPATRPACNATFPLSADMKFLYGARSGKLQLRPTSMETLAGSSPVEECPQSEIFGGLSGLIARPWPVPLNLPAERLSVRTIFGNRKRFKVEFSAVRPAKVEPLGVVLIGSMNRYSRHDAIVRFTRIG